MREIKFRAWDNKRNKIIYADGMKSIELYDDGSGMIRDIEDKILLEVGEDNPTLMQYTGLKDKNGKEIYEGDILKSTNGQIKNGIIKYHQACFWIHYPYLQDEELHEELHYSHNRIALEIVGDIYSNPELLNK